jgi:ribosomal protein S18 acetylase RimI-like enzyme
MTNANYNDKGRVVDILSQSFIDNKSVNYLVKQDAKRTNRLKNLMSYSFDICHLFGDIFLSDDKKACALIVYPDKKKTSLKSVWLDVKLAFSCIGISNLGKAMKREATIRKVHPEAMVSYLWFIGVKSGEQNKGVGSHLLSEIIDKCKAEGRIICLETSTESNLPWYKKFGFKIYKELDFGYKLFCMRKE